MLPYHPESAFVRDKRATGLYAQDDSYRDEVFNDPRLEEFPLQAVCLAVVLLVLGVLFFFLSYLHAAGHIVGHDHGHLGFLLLGVLTFLPGSRLHCTTRCATLRCARCNTLLLLSLSQLMLIKQRCMLNTGASLICAHKCILSGLGTLS